MKKLPDGRYQISNKVTGETKVVRPEELSQYGLAPEDTVPTPTPQQPVVPQQPLQQVPQTPQDPEAQVRAPMSFGGFAGNLSHNVGDIASGLFNLPKTAIESGAYSVLPGMRPVAKALGKEKSSDQFYGDLAKGVAKSYGDTFGVSVQDDPESVLPDISVNPQAAMQHAYEKPVDTALNLLPAMSMIKRGRAAKEVATAGEVAGGADEVARMGMGERVTEAGENVSRGVRQMKMPGKGYVGAAQKESAVNSTLDELGIKGSPQQQYEALQPKMTEIESQIRPMLQKNTQTFAPAQVQNDILQVLDDQGLLIGDDAKAAASEALNDVMNDVVNKGKKNTLNSEEIFDVKQKLNKMKERLQKKSDAGTATPKEEILLATRDALDDVISKYNPEVKDLTIAQSHLFDAAPSLSSARFNPPTLRAAGFSIPSKATIMAQSAAGSGLQKAGDLISKVETPFNNIVKPSLGVARDSFTRLGVAAENLENQGEQPQSDLNQDASYEQPNNQFNAESNQELPPIDQTTSPIIQEKPKTLNPFGATPEVIYREYQNALMAGDKETAANLRTMYQDEVKYQTATNPKKKSVSAAGLQVEGKARSGLQATDIIEEILTKDPNMAFKSETPGIDLFKEQERKLYESAISSLTDAIGGLRTGATVSKEQLVFYKNMLPKPGDKPETVKKKLDEVRRELGGYLNLEVDAQTPPPEDFAQLPDIGY